VFKLFTSVQEEPSYNSVSALVPGPPPATKAALFDAPKPAMLSLPVFIAVPEDQEPVARPSTIFLNAPVPEL